MACLIGQSFAAWQAFNAERAAEGLGQLSWARYVVSTDFAVDVAENWQSEFLQFWVYLVVTVCLVQLGSPESKKPEEAGPELDEEQKVKQHAVRTPPEPLGTQGYGSGPTLSPWKSSWASSSCSVGGPIRRRMGRTTKNACGTCRTPSAWANTSSNANFWSRTPPELAVRDARRRQHGGLRGLLAAPRLLTKQANRCSSSATGVDGSPPAGLLGGSRRQLGTGARRELDT
jgi:hypothetical protein